MKAWEQVREPTERELLVLDGSDRLAPVCFHSNRNAFAQAADAAGLGHEETRELLDHENVSVTKGYLRSIGASAKVVPDVHRLRSVLAAPRGFSGSLVARGRNYTWTTAFTVPIEVRVA